MSQRSSKLKWILVPAILSGVLLTLAAALPFLVDLEKFRPQIKALVGSMLNADLEFKSIRLHAIPKLGITIKSLQLKNTDKTFGGQTLFKSKEVFLATEFWPLLKGKVSGELRVAQPEINVVIKNGANNLASLQKNNQAVQPEKAPNPDQRSAKTDPEVTKTLRDRILITRILISDASANVSIDGKKVAGIKDFDLTVTNIGLDRDIDIQLVSKLAASEDGITVDGTTSLNMTSRITTSNESLVKNLRFTGDLDLTDLTMNVRNLVIKKPGQKLSLAYSGKASPDEILMDKINFQLLNITGDGQANLRNFMTLNTNARLAVKSPDISSLAQVLPQHAQLLQKASLDLAMTIDGPVTDLGKTKATLNLKTNLSGSDFTTQIAMAGIMPANGNIGITSNNLDLGALIKPFLKKQSSETNANADKKTENKSATATTAKESDENQVDFSLSNDLQTALKPHVLSVDLAFKKITWDRLAIQNIKAKGTLKNLSANLNEFSLDALGGAVTAAGSINLAAKPAAFTGKMTMEGVSASGVIDILAPDQKDAIKGTLAVDMAMNAAGTTIKTLGSTLNAKGSFALSDFTLSGNSARTMVSSAFQAYVTDLATGKSAEKAYQSLDKILNSPLAKKIPDAKKPKVSDLKKNIEKIGTVKIPEKYVGNKKIPASNGQLEIQKGKIAITSNTESDLGRIKLNATSTMVGDLSGTVDLVLSEAEKNNLLKQSDNIALLFDQNKTLNLPFKLGGSIGKPKLTLQSEQLSKNFEKNVEAKAEQEAKKALSAAGDKALKDALKKAGVSPEKEAQVKKQIESATKKFGPKATEKLKGLFKKK